MTNREATKKDLIDRIEALVEESCTLVRTKESWTRHVEIQAEIMQLCRRAADLVHDDNEAPYWETESQDADGESRESRAA